MTDFSERRSILRKNNSKLSLFFNAFEWFSSIFNLRDFSLLFSASLTDFKKPLGLCVALLGAESTGKSDLSFSLAKNLRLAGLRCEVVSEYLREWCDKHQRTPQQHEQFGIAQEQNRRIFCAQKHADLVIADTTSLMIAIYSDWFFKDRSLYAQALEHQRLFALNLITGLDLPWVADGFQRDSAETQAKIDAILRQTCLSAHLDFQVIYGKDKERVQSALRCIKRLPILQDYFQSEDENYQNNQNLQTHFSDAQIDDSSDLRSFKPIWHCENCSDSRCELRLFDLLR